ncbi:hypothetical protein M2140_001630 [Clostridiales Family XIII bacterium PM5-7]
MVDIEKRIDGLFHKDNQHAYQCLQELESYSAENNSVYRYFDIFADMMDHENSYVRNRGLLLISANAKWDEDNKIDEIIDRYLKHIQDVKPITARQCIKALGNIAKYKPELKQDILLALQRANTSIYAASMQPLVERDIRETLKRLR